jgi:hypothetical protein
LGAARILFVAAAIAIRDHENLYSGLTLSASAIILNVSSSDMTRYLLLLWQCRSIVLDRGEGGRGRRLESWLPQAFAGLLRYPGNAPIASPLQGSAALTRRGPIASSGFLRLSASPDRRIAA